MRRDDALTMIRRQRGLALVMWSAAVVQGAAATAAGLPEGFSPLFTTPDLTGWSRLPGDAQGTHWRMHDGILVGDGGGAGLVSDREFGDLELHMECMLPLAKGAADVVLPGDVRVGIGEQGGVGEGRAPQRGTWQTMRMRLQDGRLTVVRDGRDIVIRRPPAQPQGAAPPPPVRGPLRIGAQGGPLHLRTLAVRELGTLDGSGPGWRHLAEDDFVDVNCDAETWTWHDGTVHCTGEPMGVIRTRRPLTNFELAAEWRHLKPGGNSGIFLWSPPAVLQGLPRGKLPAAGIEVQALDHAFTAQYELTTGKKATWFSTDGDVFPVGASRMRPFPPVSPDGRRSFPSARHSRGSPEWNRYYVRAVDGEVRLWVNGHEVSGGSDCQPATGFLCLESEGAPVEFRRLRLRELLAPRALQE